MNNYQLPGARWPNTEIEGERYRERQIVSAIGGRPRYGTEVEKELEAVLVPEPDNPHDPNAISIRISGNVVGYIGRDDAPQYVPAIHRITASGYEATTTARIWATVSDSWTKPGTRQFSARITVYLPAPGMITPLNMRPLDDIAVLPWGNALQVTGEDKHFDHLFNYVPASGEGLVVLTLHRTTNTLKNGTEREFVEVRLDGERVGQLTAGSSAHYLPSIRHAGDMGKELGIWTRLKGSGLAAELSIQGARANELEDSWLRTLPEIATLTAEAETYDLPPAFSEAKRGPDDLHREEKAAGAARKSAPQPQLRRTSAKKPKPKLVLEDRHRKHSPKTYRSAGICLIVSSIIIGALLATIPIVGPILFLAVIAVGIYGNVVQRRIASALEAEHVRT